MRRINFFLFSLLILSSCNNPLNNPAVSETKDWKTGLDEQLPLLGHRNWILVVDKAFPAQTAEGISTIYTGAGMMNVLDYTLTEIENSTHIKPVIYTDRELEYISEGLFPGIEEYRKRLYKVLKNQGSAKPQSILHDSVFVKIDEASKLFKVLVLKTNETIPYSSVFIELGCKYWYPEQENRLKETMRKN